jgi:hypothetical protein
LKIYRPVIGLNARHRELVNFREAICCLCDISARDRLGEGVPFTPFVTVCRFVFRICNLFFSKMSVENFDYDGQVMEAYLHQVIL